MKIWSASENLKSTCLPSESAAAVYTHLDSHLPLSGVKMKINTVQLNMFTLRDAV